MVVSASIVLILYICCCVVLLVPCNDVTTTFLSSQSLLLFLLCFKPLLSVLVRILLRESRIVFVLSLLFDGFADNLYHVLVVEPVTETTTLGAVLRTGSPYQCIVEIA